IETSDPFLARPMGLRAVATMNASAMGSILDEGVLGSKERVTHDLAGRVAGKSIATDLPLRGDFVVCETAAHPAREGLGGEGLSFARDDDGSHPLAELVVGHADDARLEHVLVGLEAALDLGGVDVLSAAED